MYRKAKVFAVIYMCVLRWAHQSPISSSFGDELANTKRFQRSTPLDLVSFMINIRCSVIAVTDDQIRSGGRAAADGPANVSSSRAFVL